MTNDNNSTTYRFSKSKVLRERLASLVVLIICTVLAPVIYTLQHPNFVSNILVAYVLTGLTFIYYTLRLCRYPRRQLTILDECIEIKSLFGTKSWIVADLNSQKNKSRFVLALADCHAMCDSNGSTLDVKSVLAKLFPSPYKQPHSIDPIQLPCPIICPNAKLCKYAVILFIFLTFCLTLAYATECDRETNFPLLITVMFILTLSFNYLFLHSPQKVILKEFGLEVQYLKYTKAYSYNDFRYLVPSEAGFSTLVLKDLRESSIRGIQLDFKTIIWLNQTIPLNEISQSQLNTTLVNDSMDQAVNDGLYKDKRQIKRLNVILMAAIFLGIVPPLLTTCIMPFLTSSSVNQVTSMISVILTFSILWRNHKLSRYKTLSTMYASFALFSVLISFSWFEHIQWLDIELLLLYSTISLIIVIATLYKKLKELFSSKLKLIYILTTIFTLSTNTIVRVNTLFSEPQVVEINAKVTSKERQSKKRGRYKYYMSLYCDANGRNYTKQISGDTFCDIQKGSDIVLHEKTGGLGIKYISCYQLKEE